MRIAIPEDGKGIHFKPVARIKPHVDAVLVTARGRGGVEVMIEGTRAQEVQKALQNCGEGNFFFLTKNQSTGWIETTPYKGYDAPPRNRAHLRIWDSRSTNHDALMSSLQPANINDFYAQVKSAQALIADYRSKHTVGRKPMEVVQAEATLRTLVDLFVQTASVNEMIANPVVSDQLKALVAETIDINHFLKSPRFVEGFRPILQSYILTQLGEAAHPDQPLPELQIAAPKVPATRAKKSPESEPEPTSPTPSARRAPAKAGSSRQAVKVNTTERRARTDARSMASA
jgi:hypothetical protein